MIKLVKTIIGTDKLMVIGFEAEGRAKEFGEIGNDIVTRRLTVEDLMRANFSNNQIYIKNNMINEVDKFKIKNLPMIAFDPSTSTFRDVDNTMELKARVLIDGELKGFDVFVAGTLLRLTTSDVINRSNLFITKNFVVRYSAGKRYIAGKPGMSLDTLPAVTLTNNDKKTGKKAVRTATASTGHTYDVVRISPFDMISLCEVLNEIGGKFIYLPGIDYKRITNTDSVVSSEFKKTGVEISKPDIAYSEKKLNTNLPFNQIGQLIVNVAGANKTYYPYVNKQKTIFKGGELNSPYLGVVIKTEDVDVLQKRFGASMSLSVITSKMTNIYVKTFLNVPDPETYTLLALNTKNLSPMCKENCNTYQMSEADIYKSVLKLNNIKVALSYVKGLRKELEGFIVADGGMPRPLYGAYRAASDIELQALKDAGIDVFTGEFIKREEVDESKHKVVSSEEHETLEITYGIEGMKSLPTYSTISKNKEKALAKFPMAADIVKKADNIYATPGKPNDQYKALKSLEDELTKHRGEIFKQLWMHNIACYTLGGYQDIKVKDRAHWTQTGSVKGGSVWTYLGTGASAGLTCTVKGTTLI